MHRLNGRRKINVLQDGLPGVTLPLLLLSIEFFFTVFSLVFSRLVLTELEKPLELSVVRGTESFRFRPIEVKVNGYAVDR